MSTPITCAGDFHVWTHGEPVCRCGSRTPDDYLTHDPSLRDVLAKLEAIERKLDEELAGRRGTVTNR